jgi:hypothetical protein
MSVNLFQNIWVTWRKVQTENEKTHYDEWNNQRETANNGWFESTVACTTVSTSQRESSTQIEMEHEQICFRTCFNTEEHWYRETQAGERKRLNGGNNYRRKNERKMKAYMKQVCKAAATAAFTWRIWRKLRCFMKASVTKAKGTVPICGRADKSAHAPCALPTLRSRRTLLRINSPVTFRLQLYATPHLAACFRRDAGTAPTGCVHISSYLCVVI